MRGYIPGRHDRYSCIVYMLAFARRTTRHATSECQSQLIPYNLPAVFAWDAYLDLPLAAVLAARTRLSPIDHDCLSRDATRRKRLHDDGTG